MELRAITTDAGVDVKTGKNLIQLTVYFDVFGTLIAFQDGDSPPKVAEGLRQLAEFIEIEAGKM